MLLRSSLSGIACVRGWVSRLVLAECLMFGVGGGVSVEADEPAVSLDRKAKTYTEELRSTFEGAFQQQEFTRQVLEKRAQRFGSLPSDISDDLRIKYESTFAAFRQSVAELHQIYLQHHMAWTAEGDRQRLAEYGKRLNEAQQRLESWRSALAEVYLASEFGSDTLLETMVEMIKYDAGRDLYEGLGPLATALLRRSETLPPPLWEEIGYVGYANNDYDLAESAWTRLKETQKLPAGIELALSLLSEQRRKWEEEVSRRQVDEARNDNPRVSILTNKGLMVVELFEEEAPQAVANFLYLVEQRFYDRKFFFRVIDRFAAQTGCERGDGTGNAGYTIRGEMNASNHRNIFRGSLVLLSGVDEKTKRPDPDSGSSQFLISMLPQPVFDGQMTVFGRVVDGLHVLGALERLDLSLEEERKDKSKKPDRMVELKILRKREHVYLPEVVRGSLP